MSNIYNKVSIAAIVFVTLLLGSYQVFAKDSLWTITRYAYQPNNLGLASDSENNIILTFRLHDTLHEISTIRTEKVSSESGKSLWWNNYEFDDVGYARDVATDSQDNIIVVGDSMVGDFDSDWVIVKYDFDGNEDWRTDYDSGGYDITFGVSVDLNDEIIVVGLSDSTYLARRYDAEGVCLDEMTYDGVEAKPYDVTTDDECNVIVVGREGLGDPDYFVVVYDSYGDEIWRDTYHRYGTEIANGVVADSDGNVYVTGYSQFEREGAIPYFGYLTLKYDSSGNLVWNKAYDNEVWSSYANEIAIDQQGYIYVTGISNEEIFTISYSPEGQENLVKRHSFEVDPGVGMRVVVDSRGNLIVLGYKETSGAWEETYVMKYLISTGTESTSIETRVEALEEEVDLLTDLLETVQEIIQSILDWIDDLPPGLSSETGKPSG